MRTVADLERAGAAAVQLEDQVTPKKCGHFDGKEVVATPEMVAKIRAAIDARGDSDLVLIARTDAVQSNGIDEAIARARAYRDAGADVIFVEAPRTLAELRRIPQEVTGVPLLVNVVEGGVTPALSLSEYEALGYRVVLYANLALRVSALAVRSALGQLARDGGSDGLRDAMLQWPDRQELVHLPELQDLERRYSTNAVMNPRAREGAGS
jgi:2-methylisocitrate lyase-like PEP mutase family enzyme